MVVSTMSQSRHTAVASRPRGCHLGQMVGTNKTFASMRCFAAGSTSTPSCGYGDSLAPEFANFSMGMKALAFEYDAVAVIRLQESLGEKDFLKLHGYIILKIKEKIEACKERQGEELQDEEPQGDIAFVRIDFGADGLHLQVSDNDTQFLTYANATDFDAAPVREAAGIGAFFAPAAAKVVAAACSAQPVGEAACRQATAAGATAAVATEGAGATAGMYTACAANPMAATLGAACMVVGGAMYLNHKCQQKPEYIPVQNSLKHLLKAIEAKKEERYDLANWNCNHFADYLVDALVSEVP